MKQGATFHVIGVLGIMARILRHLVSCHCLAAVFSATITSSKLLMLPMYYGRTDRLVRRREFRCSFELSPSHWSLCARFSRLKRRHRPGSQPLRSANPLPTSLFLTPPVRPSSYPLTKEKSFCSTSGLPGALDAKLRFPGIWSSKTNTGKTD